MSWGFGYACNSGGKGAREVAEAFYAGKKRTRGNAHTDGRTYFLFDHPIARRTPVEEIPEMVAEKLLGNNPPRLLEFSWAGYATSTTEAHLKALGVPGAWKGTWNQREPRKPEICGRPVDCSRWYTLEEAAALPKYEPPPKQKRTEFVNLTPRLPGFA